MSGKPSTTVLGIDVGGTKIAMRAVSYPQRKVLGERFFLTRAERGGQAVLKQVRANARSMMTEGCGGVGVGICELVTSQGEIVSRNALSWTSEQVRNALGEFGTVTIEADVRAAALGEAVCGAGRGFKTFVYVTVGTGISCCLMIGLQPYLGASGLTGTMASSPLPGLHRKGKPVTLEDMASGAGIIARFRELGGFAGETKEVLTMAESGNKAAGDVVRSAASALGAQIGLVVNILDPEAVVIGGGLGVSGGLFERLLLEETRRCIWSSVNRQVPIKVAELGNHAGVIGATLVAYKAVGGLVS